MKNIGNMFDIISENEDISFEESVIFNFENMLLKIVKKKSCFQLFS